jgi:hypothetical protein
MTPKEKAQELFDKYWTLIAYKIEGSVGRLVIKQCALIAVDEILSDYKNYLLHENTEYKGLMYWTDVKKEIEKL